jgi:transcriptional regulator GlxA family with amidase domain
MHVSLLLFEHCDLLDVGGPYEVFLTASRLAERAGLDRPFEVATVTPDGQPVAAYGGLGLVPSAPTESLASTDLLVVPGAIDLAAVLANHQVLDLVDRTARRSDVVVASVCTGAFVLGAVGLLGGRAWTTHWEDVDQLAASMDQPDRSNRAARWVDEGRVVTSGGLSSGIAMALHLVERFAGRSLADQTARQIDYEWTPRRATSPADSHEMG